ncbi:unnamed protein product [Prunus armeniaca]
MVSQKNEDRRISGKIPSESPRRATWRPPVGAVSGDVSAGVTLTPALTSPTRASARARFALGLPRARGTRHQPGLRALRWSELGQPFPPSPSALEML